MTPQTTTAQIPAELKPADGRFGCGPSKVRPEALATLAEQLGADGHLAPPGAGRATWSAACATGLGRALRRCPTATRSCSATAARPPSGTPPPPGWCASAPCTSPTASSRRSSPRRPPAAPFLADPILVEAEPGDAPAPAADPAADVDRLGPQRDLDRGHGRRSQRPEGAGEALVLSTPPRAPAACRVDVAAGRRLLLRPAEGLRRRRRPLAGRCSARPRSRGSSELDGAAGRWQPAFLSLQTALENSRKEQTYNTPGAGDPAPARRPGRVDARRRRPRLVRRAHLAPPRGTSTAGPSAASSRRRSSPTRRSARWSSARSTSTTRSTPPRSPRPCAPTASSTSSPTASSAATSCGSGCSRRSSPPTSRR